MAPSHRSVRLSLPRLESDSGPRVSFSSLFPRLANLGGCLVQQGRILIVDDEASFRRSLAALLKSEGYDVAVAHDAFEALARFDELAPALTITDLTMPGLHGLELSWAKLSRLSR